MHGVLLQYQRRLEELAEQRDAEEVPLWKSEFVPDLLYVYYRFYGFTFIDTNLKFL